MAVKLNHTIVLARDRDATAKFFVDIFGLAPPRPYGPFLDVVVANEVTLAVIESHTPDIQGQHYAFLVSEAEFDDILGRVQARGIDYWADYMHRQQGEINRNDGGRGAYFDAPDGHYLEIITRPYGSGA